MKRNVPRICLVSSLCLTDITVTILELSLHVALKYEPIKLLTGLYASMLIVEFAARPELGAFLY